ncbi:MAG: hypothetical protein H7A46_19365 [Verrucomicrobiales bacterium]|nr:hypothetical protein [Verrucomicrobiales bacterium]
MSDHVQNRVHALLHTPALPDLGPGPRAHVQSADTIRTAMEDLKREAGIPERQHQLLTALVLLWHDRLEAAHRIVQEIHDADGSLLHAIMHRREPDYWNSKYWWRHVGGHPVYGPLGATVAERLRREPEAESLAARLVPGGRWDPFAFVDEAQRLASLPEDSPEVTLARELQKLECEAVLQHLTP